MGKPTRIRKRDGTVEAECPLPTVILAALGATGDTPGSLLTAAHRLQAALDERVSPPVGKTTRGDERPER